MKRAAFLLATLSLAATSSAHACPEPAATGIQLCDSDMEALFSKAATNTLGSAAPTMGQISTGQPSHRISPFFPCALLRAIAENESSWLQFVGASSCGSSGTTLISGDCGYGIMQITSGMDGTGGFSPSRVASSPAYNIGTGARSLAEDWLATPVVGQNDPSFVESWYFATWAYNGFSYINNPNNPRYAAGRAHYRSLNGTTHNDYPYQEIIWGYLEYPVGTRAPSVAVSYPDSSEICSTSGCAPTHVSLPTPTHSGSCGDSNGGPLAVNDDAGTAIDGDAGTLSDGEHHTVVTTTSSGGCSINSATPHTPSRTALSLALAALALVALRRKR